MATKIELISIGYNYINVRDNITSIESKILNSIDVEFLLNDMFICSGVFYTDKNLSNEQLIEKIKEKLWKINF